MRSLRASRLPWLQVLANIGALVPLALLIRDWALDQLSADPALEITLRTGRAALALLALALAVTPAYRLSGMKALLPLRRTLGLYAFLYAGLHLLNFAGLDYGFDFSLLAREISGKYFVLIGFAAFLLLLPLAVTSTAGWRRRLGRNWARLHWLLYPAAALALAHFILASVLGARGDLLRLLLYGLPVALLLAIRLPAGKIVRKLRRRIKGNS